MKKRTDELSEFVKFLTADERHSDWIASGPLIRQRLDEFRHRYDLRDAILLEAQLGAKE
jgi:hypothetical protein